MGVKKFKNLFAGPATTPSSKDTPKKRPDSGQKKAEIEILKQKIDQIIKKDPQGAKKLAQIIEKLLS